MWHVVPMSNRGRYMENILFRTHHLKWCISAHFLKGGSATPPLGSLVLQIVKAQSGLDCKRRVRHSYRLRTVLNVYSVGRFCARYTKRWSHWKQNRIVQIDETPLLWYSGLVVKPEQPTRTVTIEYLNKKKPYGLQTYGNEEQYRKYRSCFDYSTDLLWLSSTRCMP